jgi:hypothetical protein
MKALTKEEKNFAGLSAVITSNVIYGKESLAKGTKEHYLKYAREYYDFANGVLFALETIYGKEKCKYLTEKVNDLFHQWNNAQSTMGSF